MTRLKWALYFATIYHNFAYNKQVWRKKNLSKTKFHLNRLHPQHQSHRKAKSISSKCVRTHWHSTFFVPSSIWPFFRWEKIRRFPWRDCLPCHLDPISWIEISWSVKFVTLVAAISNAHAATTSFKEIEITPSEDLMDAPIEWITPERELGPNERNFHWDVEHISPPNFF